MTTPTPDAPEVPGAGEQCPNCPHPLEAHDTIARRYCAAASAGEATNRGCVCGTVQDHQGPDGPRGHKSHTTAAPTEQQPTRTDG